MNRDGAPIDDRLRDQPTFEGRDRARDMKGKVPVIGRLWTIEGE